MLEIVKINGNKKLLGISMPIDKVLQSMFLNFLDVLLEEKLKPKVFGYRKGRDARTAVASVYIKLNRVKSMEQTCLCSVNIKKCFDWNTFYDQIMKQYPFPKNYDFLLFRWLIPNFINKKLKKVNYRIFQGFVLGSSIANILFSNAFPKNILKKRGKNKRKV